MIMREVVFAEREHIPLIADLEAKTFANPSSESTLHHLLDTDGAKLVICIEDGKLLSYCSAVFVLDEVQILNVATAPEYKKQGFAKEVIGFLINESKKSGMLSISLEVRVSNVPAISLYNGFGFFVAGTRKDFYVNPRENAFVMIKNLD